MKNKHQKWRVNLLLLLLQQVASLLQLHLHRRHNTPEEQVFDKKQTQPRSSRGNLLLLRVTSLLQLHRRRNTPQEQVIDEKQRGVWGRRGESKSYS